MRKNKKIFETRAELIEGTVLAISKYGIEDATTKRVSLETGINEAYIYRAFEDKEDMFVKTFEVLDNELVEKIMQHIPVMFEKSIAYEDRCRAFFLGVWRFILSKKDRCKTYIRYYYSPLFMKYSYEIHRSKYTEILDGFKAAFVDDVDVWVEFKHIFHIMLSSAMRVFDGELDETAETEEKIFFLIYSVIKPHLKNNADK